MIKCIVLDLDNTLWGGVIGEDGMDNIKLSSKPPGSYFLSFQQALYDLTKEGIILAINSKNNEADALKVIDTHPHMILKREHFAAWRINWQDKAKNCAEIAQELNIGMDSLLFLDDDHLNRELVRATLPEITVLDLPKDPAEYTQFLLSLNITQSQNATDEDRMRTNLYTTERIRSNEEKKYTTKKEFLSALNMKLDIYHDDPSAAARIAQLTEKTNQFNTNKYPYNEVEIANFIKNPNAHVIHARAYDKFGDYGIIAVAIIKTKSSSWTIHQLIMSCRALDRGIEEAFFNHILERARTTNIQEIHIEFNPTEKNMPAQNFIAAHAPEYKIHTSYTLPSSPVTTTIVEMQKT